MIENPKLRAYDFLADMTEDAYFPNGPVAKVKAVLVRLCETIEAKKPKTLEELYVLTHAATDEINALEDDFEEEESEIETVARECICADFEVIARAYGFDDADVEELTATRDW
jgi:hypothetical protein